MTSDHDKIIQLSAIKYLEQLQGINKNLSGELDAVIDSLIQSLGLALEIREELGASEMPFRASIPP